jgi:phospholipid/cholesterol/gamma-HCH transport system ATP-binding protein
VPAITFDHVITAGISLAATFRIETGALAAVIAPRQEISDLLVRLLLGISKQDSGTIEVLGVEPAEIPERELSSLQQQIGVVTPSGGLIFNLKVWENILLPMEYHKRISQKEIEERGEAALRAVGIGFAVYELPGHLSLFEHRLVGQARSFAMQPALLVYNELLGGLREEDQGRLTDNALAYHRDRPKTTSLFLTALPETIRSLPFDQCIVL